MENYPFEQNKLDKKYIRLLNSCLLEKNHAQQPLIRIVLDCIESYFSLDSFSRLAYLVAVRQYELFYDIRIENAPSGEQWKKLKDIDNQLKGSDCSSWYCFTTAPFITKDHAQWAIDRFTPVSEEAKRYNNFIELFKAGENNTSLSNDEYLTLKNRYLNDSYLNNSYPNESYPNNGHLGEFQDNAEVFFYEDYDVYANKDFVKPLYDGSECKNFIMHKKPHLNRKKWQALASTLATYSYYDTMMHK